MRTLAPKGESRPFDVGTVFHDLILGNRYLVTWETFAKLRTVAMWTACPEPGRPPDHVSGSKSRYWNEQHGAIRQSDHWGQVGNSYWALRGHGITGYCAYSHHLAGENFIPIPPDVLASKGAKGSSRGKNSRPRTRARSC